MWKASALGDNYQSVAAVRLRGGLFAKKVREKIMRIIHHN